MVARNFQADYQRPVGNGPPRIVALLEYRFLELIGPLAYPPSVVARHFFFYFFPPLSPPLSPTPPTFFAFDDASVRFSKALSGER